MKAPALESPDVGYGLCPHNCPRCHQCAHADFCEHNCPLCRVPVPHVHTVNPALTSPPNTHNGVQYEHCACGAIRSIRKGVTSAWHTCALCTHPWGLK